MCIYVYIYIYIHNELETKCIAINFVTNLLNYDIFITKLYHKII